MPVTARLAAVSVALLVATSGARASAAPTKEACVDAYERAQYARRDAKLRDARTLLLLCGQPACGLTAARDCGRWLIEVESALPTIVFAARTEDGHEVVATTVTMDEHETIAKSLDGASIAVDPGVHTFRFETQGSEPVTTRLTVHEGEKSRLVNVTFPPLAHAPEHATPRGGSVWPSLVLGGAGAALLAGSLAVGLVAKNDFDSLRATGCAPNCPSSQVSPIETKAVLSDVFLGLGIAAAAFGVTLFVVRAHASDAPHGSAVTHMQWPLSF